MSIAPLTPPGCDISDFPRMMLDIHRLRGSSFDATLNDSAWRAGLNLWMTAWHQVPAASLDQSEEELTKAAGLGRDLKTWRKVKDVALRGWRAADDGRIYHETLAELALEAWIDKLGQRLSSTAGNAKRHKLEFAPGPIYDDIRAAAEHLRVLNPRSRSLTKQLVLKAIAGGDDLPPGDVGVPPGVPSGSQGNGMERKLGEGSKSHSPNSGRGRRETRAPEPKIEFLGPKEVRAAFLAKLGEDWCGSYLDPCTWQDVPERALIPATGRALDKIRQDGWRILKEHGISVLERAA